MASGAYLAQQVRGPCALGYCSEEAIGKPATGMVTRCERMT